MNNKFFKEYVITPGMCDHTSKLGYADTFSLFQDIASEHADELGIGANLLPEKGLFWLTVKTKIHFHKRPKMMSRAIASTWPKEAEDLRCDRDYLLTSPDGEVLAEGKTEWAILNYKTGRPIRCGEIYPEGLVIAQEDVCTEGFTRIDPDFTGCEKLGEYTVRSIDIDLGGHMNNVAYIRNILGLFSSARLKDMNIKDIEVYFKKSCFEGEKLTFHVRRGEATDIGMFKEDGSPAFFARIR